LGSKAPSSLPVQAGRRIPKKALKLLARKLQRDSEVATAQPFLCQS